MNHIDLFCFSAGISDSYEENQNYFDGERLQYVGRTRKGGSIPASEVKKFTEYDEAKHHINITLPVINADLGNEKVETSISKVPEDQAKKRIDNESEAEAQFKKKKKAKPSGTVGPDCE